MKVISTVEHSRSLGNIEKLCSTDVLHISDVFDMDYLETIFSTKGRPGYVVSDSFNNFSDCYCLPLWIELETKKILAAPSNSVKVDTDHCFNFQINKKQINRFLCMKLVEYFKLTDFDYTWSGVDVAFDMSQIIVEMNTLGNACPIVAARQGELLSPISVPKKFVLPPGSAPINGNSSSITNYGSNLWVWKHVLSNLITRTAVSLITESLTFQRCSVFTEKTLYSVLGLTFPIWIGGYKQADEWHQLGFDVFDDIVNHDYQHYNTLIERCYYAVELNLRLLTDRKWVAQLRKKNMPRLLKNRQLLENNHLEKYNNIKIVTWPADLQQAMPDILKYFR